MLIGKTGIIIGPEIFMIFTYDIVLLHVENNASCYTKVLSVVSFVHWLVNSGSFEEEFFEALKKNFLRKRKRKQKLE